MRTRSKVMAAAGLAVLVATAVAPVAVCAGMPGCPMTATVAAGCHVGSAAVGPSCHHCTPASHLAARECCAAADRGPMSAVEGRRVAAPVQVSSLSPAAEKVRFAADPAPAAPPPFLDTGPAPSGRELLSLHQTLLI